CPPATRPPRTGPSGRRAVGTWPTRGVVWTALPTHRPKETWSIPRREGEHRVAPAARSVAGRSPLYDPATLLRPQVCNHKLCAGLASRAALAAGSGASPGTVARSALGVARGWGRPQSCLVRYPVHHPTTLDVLYRRVKAVFALGPVAVLLQPLAQERHQVPR